MKVLGLNRVVASDLKGKTSAWQWHGAFDCSGENFRFVECLFLDSLTEKRLERLLAEKQALWQWGLSFLIPGVSGELGSGVMKVLGLNRVVASDLKGKTSAWQWHGAFDCSGENFRFVECLFLDSLTEKRLERLLAEKQALWQWGLSFLIPGVSGELGSGVMKVLGLNRVVASDLKGKTSAWQWHGAFDCSGENFRFVECLFLDSLTEKRLERLLAEKQALWQWGLSFLIPGVSGELGSGVMKVLGLNRVVASDLKGKTSAWQWHGAFDCSGENFRFVECLFLDSLTEKRLERLLAEKQALWQWGLSFLIPGVSGELGSGVMKVLGLNRWWLVI